MTDESDSNGSPATGYVLTINGEGLQFSHKINADQLAAVMSVALGVVPSAARRDLEKPILNNGPQSRAERVSLREFLDASGAKKLPEKILVIAHYVEEHEGQEAFSRDDVKSRFRLAGEAQPGNFPRDFSVAISSGWIAEDHAAKGSFYVTKTGRSAIDSTFDPDVARVQRRVPRKRRTGRSLTGPDE